MINDDEPGASMNARTNAGTKKKGILDRLKDGPVLGDGGYLLELEKRGWVRAGPFTPEVALIYPDALRELHIEFREAGAEVLQALTFTPAATNSRPSASRTASRK